MPQDAYHIRFLSEELNEALQGSKITKINQTEKDEIIFHVYTGARALKVTLSANASSARVCYSEPEKQAQSLPGSFCMLLRKYLTGAEILSVGQIGFERIIAIRLRCISDFSLSERTLYAELMGKYSNLILVDGGVILGALKMTSLEVNYKRVLFAGAKYELPESQGKTDPRDFSALAQLFANFSGSDAARFIADNVQGVAYTTALLLEEGYDGTPWAEYLQNALFSSEKKPCVTFKNGAPNDFFARAAKGAVFFDSVCAAEDYYYTNKERAKHFADAKRRLEHLALNLKKKQEKRIEQILAKQAECEDMEENKIRGDLILSNLYRIERGDRFAEVENYYDESYPTLKIPLDTALNPSQNAQRYYKKYNKQKRTVAAIEPQFDRESEELEYSEGLLASVRRAENEVDLKEIEEEMISIGLIREEKKGKKKQEAAVPFRAFHSDGFTILAGRNNLSNDRLVKSAAPHDLWLHTQKYHSSHVIIVTEGKDVPDSVLLRAAEICAYYSDGKNGDKIPVDYCLKRNVKKPNKAKAGFVIYTDYKTLLVTPRL